MTDPAKVIIVLSFFGWVGYIVKHLTSRVFLGSGDRLPQVSDAHDERLARIEQAVEAIAIEVERISEGQRFTTKLLADRAQADLVARVDTPSSSRRSNASH
jgi:hypothetical protein